MKKNLTEIWRREASKRQAKAAADELPVAREFAGLPCMARRIDWQVWMRGRRVPDFFVRAAIGEEQLAEAEARTLTPDETIAGLNFQRNVVCRTLAVPTVAAREGEHGDFIYADFVERFPDAVAEIMAWQMAGAPGVPVAMTDGTEASIAELDGFRGGNGSAKGIRKARTGKRRTSQRKTRDRVRDSSARV